MSVYGCGDACLGERGCVNLLLRMTTRAIFVRARSTEKSRISPCHKVMLTYFFLLYITSGIFQHASLQDLLKTKSDPLYTSLKYYVCASFAVTPFTKQSTGFGPVDEALNLVFRPG